MEQHGTNDRSHHPKYFIGRSSFSIYQEMAAQLNARGWRPECNPERMVQCHLILGDRFDIPYHLLSTWQPYVPKETKAAVDDKENCIEAKGMPATCKLSCSSKLWINYFKGSHKLTLKAPMAAELSKYEPSSAQWMPRTFVLCGDKKKRGVVDERETLAQLMVDRPGLSWIVKPSSGCKGNGILLSKDIAEIVDFVDNAKTVYVVQQYIDRPLLLQGHRKFDIRVWALLVSPYRMYLFSEASCRTSSEPFSMDSFANPLVHLTNHCLQEKGAHFSAFEAGNELWLSQLHHSAMITTPCAIERIEKGGSLQQTLVPQIKNIIVKTLNCVEEEIVVLPTEPFQCFQLFGYDLMVDEDLNVSLLEINGSPGAAQALLPAMVEGIVKVLEEEEKACETKVHAKDIHCGAEGQYSWTYLDSSLI